MNQAAKELANDILTNAVECDAIGYWTCRQAWVRDEEDHMIVSLEFEVRDEDTMKPVEPRVVYNLDAKKILAAMKRIATDDSLRINPHLRKRIADMWKAKDYLEGEGGDTQSDDVIVQIAALGEITFG